jgi:hypothetical protein
MLVKPTTKLYALLADDGAVIPDTVLTEAEFNNPVHRHGVEDVALTTSGCTRVRWEDVSNNDEFWLDDEETFVLTEQGQRYLAEAASVA